MIELVENSKELEALFKNTTDTVIISCLQGVMGRLYASQDRTSAMAFLGDFAFPVGRPDLELISYIFNSLDKKFCIIVPENDEWLKALVASDLKGQVKSRYGLIKDYNKPDVFDTAKLTEMAKMPLPEGYSVKLIDNDLYEDIKSQEWCRDFVNNFYDFDHFNMYGFGVVLLKGDEVIAGASSYSAFKEGIEIEIVTKEEYRRLGYARIMAATLILKCLERGLYPSWDAANIMSLELAKSLGYTPSGEYKVYEVNRC